MGANRAKSRQQTLSLVYLLLFHLLMAITVRAQCLSCCT